MNAETNVEIIDIDSSSEEEGDGNSDQSSVGGPPDQIEEKKPGVALTTVKIPGPAQILEARRKKIDELLEYYGDTHNRLLSLLPFMNPNQKAQWHKLLNTKQRQILPELHEEPQSEPQSQPSNHSLNDLRNEFAQERIQVAARIKRVAQVGRYKRKKRTRKRSSPKKTYTARKPTIRKSTATKSSTYTPRVNIKTEVKPSNSALFAYVKKEK